MIKTTFAARLGLFLWLIATVFIAWKVGFEPGKHTVVNSYLLGAQRWLEQINLYSGPHGFIYMPAFAVLFMPFTYLPEIMSDALWRILLLTTYLYALSQLVKVLIKTPEQFWQWFGLVSLIALPIAFSGLRNGQMNVLLSSVMVMVTAWLIQGRWNISALVLALVMSLKPTFAVFFLLAVALYRPLWWRVPPFLFVFLCIPFVAGGFEYGAQQYINFYHMSREAMDLGVESSNWATFFNIFPQVFGVFVSEPVQIVIKIPLALMTLWYCYRKMQVVDPVTAGLVMLTMAGCYHMLFNPRGVNTDFVILGSIMGFWFMASREIWQDKCLSWLVGMNAVMILGAYELSKLITPGHDSWVNPLAAALFTILVLWQFRISKAFKTEALKSEAKP